MAKFLRHANNNLLCVMDVETTGLQAGFHDISQICILPINGNFEPLQDGTLPFTMYLKPKRPENADPEAMRTHKMSPADLILKGIDPYQAADYFLEWFEQLKLGGTAVNNYKLMPIGHNIAYDKYFIMDWLGPKTYEYCFHWHTRDTMQTALYMNDRCAVFSEAIPFPKLNLSYVASQVGVTSERSHDAIQDCVTTIACYKAMTRYFLPS